MGQSKHFSFLILSPLHPLQAKAFELSYLEKVPEVKDTVHKQSLLHHVCTMVVEKFPDSSDLYSEIGAITRSAKVCLVGKYICIYILKNPLYSELFKILFYSLILFLTGFTIFLNVDLLCHSHWIPKMAVISLLSFISVCQVVSSLLMYVTVRNYFQVKTLFNQYLQIYLFRRLGNLFFKADTWLYFKGSRRNELFW